MFTPDTPNFQSLMLMLDAAHMGWWKADFQAGELHVSEYIAKLLGLDGDKVRIGQLTHLVREDYRMPIHNEFMALKVDSKFDRTFPIELPEGEVWLHAQLVGRQTDPATGCLLYTSIHGTYEADALVASHGDRGDRTGEEHRTAQRKDRDDLRHFDLLGNLVAAGHDRNHVVFAVEQLGKQARIFDFDGFDYLIFFTHSLQIQIYNGAKVTIFYRYLFYL